MDIRENILNALRLSLIGDNAKIAESTRALEELCKYDGFCLALMEIIDHQEIEIYVKQAALVQLKNTIKSSWKPRNDANLKSIS